MQLLCWLCRPLDAHWGDAGGQGIRRVIAVTASEAEEAVSKAEGLTKAMDAAEQLEASKLDAEIAGLRQV